MRAIELTAYGDTDAGNLRIAERPEPVPEAGQVLVDVRRAGVNYADLSRRRGTYDRRDGLAPPLVLGVEVAGVRRDTGARTVALTGGYGGYAEVAAVDEGLAFPVPDGVTDDAALALLLQGLTAHHVLRTAGGLGAGESVVIHAAAGGVGSLAVQLARIWEAGRVVGVASTPEKRELVLELGADAAIDADPDGLADRIAAANRGRRADVIAESVGGATRVASRAALAPGGRLVTFGAAGGAGSGAPDPREVAFSLPTLLGDRAALAGPLAELLALARSGALQPVLGGVYALEDAARAHADLAARRTTGKLLLDV
ncbi:quinone oxidoreductase family protein [Conexibacter woesei]|uniref:quinone oxidoreductase family protein n=1 Tax=Conexibacter woesei TaxID=191495 RepID=UPI0003F67468|nr:zinc-binding alcohol dehydrogenase family protein [Conexibacter woesei]